MEERRGKAENGGEKEKGKKERGERGREDKTKEETSMWFQESRIGNHMLCADSPNYRSSTKKTKKKKTLLGLG